MPRTNELIYKYNKYQIVDSYYMYRSFRLIHEDLGLILVLYPDEKNVVSVIRSYKRVPARVMAMWQLIVGLEIKYEK